MAESRFVGKVDLGTGSTLAGNPISGGAVGGDAVVVHLTGAANTPNNTTQVLGTDIGSYDTGLTFGFNENPTLYTVASSGVTINTTGTYLLTIYGEWAANGTGARLLAFNGVIGGNVEIASSGGGTVTGASHSIIAQITAGTEIAGAVRQQSGGNLNFGGAGAGSHSIRIASLDGDSGNPGVQITNSSAITSTDTADVNERVLYDPSGGTFTINAPASPSLGDKFAVKNRTSDLTGVTISGNGSNIEDPTSSFALAASFSLVGDGVAAEWEYDGTAWLAV